MRRPSPFGLRVALLIGFAIGSLLAGAAATAGEATGNKIDRQLRAVERAIGEDKKRTRELGQKARSLQAEVARARRQRIATAKSIQLQEQTVSDLEAEVDDLNKAAVEKNDLLQRRRGQSAKLLAALQRLALNPPESVIAQPVSPADLVRGAVLLRSTLPQIEDQAARLRDDLTALAETRRAIGERRQQLASATTKLRRERKNLDAMLLSKSAEHRLTLAARRKVTRRLRSLTARAKDLKDLFREIRRQRDLERKKARVRKQAVASKRSRGQKTVRPRRLPAPPSGSRKITDFRGNLHFPAAGRIVGRYGEANASGRSRKGLSVETRAGAQVTAPFEGQIVFAGEFRGYGQLLIIEHGQGYHTLLSGMARIDGVLGQSLVAGEPVGIMGSPSKGRPSLYIELRRKGQPINPTPWMVAQKGKVKG